MEPHVDLRRALITAALEILETEGKEPSLRAVARAAGVSAMAPYWHFTDKGDLMAAVAGYGFESLNRALAAADDTPDAREALVAQGLAFIDFAGSHPALFRLMYGDRYGNAGIDLVRDSYRILADRVAGLRPEDASAATLGCRALVQGIATIVLNDRLAPSKLEDVATALRLFVFGLEPRG